MSSARVVEIVGLSPATSATLDLSCQHSVGHSKVTAGDKPEEGGDDVKSSCPLWTWATHVLQWTEQRAARNREVKPIPKICSHFRIAVCNSTA